MGKVSIKNKIVYLMIIVYAEKILSFYGKAKVTGEINSNFKRFFEIKM